MFKLYSKGCEYALRLLASVDKSRLIERFTAQDCCRHTGIPEAFTRKTLQALARKGILSAGAGRTGGYRLSRPAKEISVLDIVLAVEGEDYFDSCVMGKSLCSDNKPCPLHESWLRSKAPLLKNLNSVTLEQMVRRYQKQKGEPK